MKKTTNKAARGLVEKVENKPVTASMRILEALSDMQKQIDDNNAMVKIQLAEIFAKLNQLNAVILSSGEKDHYHNINDWMELGFDLSADDLKEKVMDFAISNLGASHMCILSGYYLGKGGYHVQVYTTEYLSEVHNIYYCSTDVWDGYRRRVQNKEHGGHWEDIDYKDLYPPNIKSNEKFLSLIDSEEESTDNLIWYVAIHGFDYLAGEYGITGCENGDTDFTPFNA